MRIALALALLAALPAAAGARCLRYDPDVVTLSGELNARRVPGPPDYRNIARGDYPEDIYVLVLDQPVCVIGDPTSRRNSRSYGSIAEIQLVPTDDVESALAGKVIRATGYLITAQSGHHRTPVLLRVSQLRAIE